LSYLGLGSAEKFSFLTEELITHSGHSDHTQLFTPLLALTGHFHCGGSERWVHIADRILSSLTMVMVFVEFSTRISR